MAGVLILGFDRKASCWADMTGHYLDSDVCCNDLNDFQLDLDDTVFDLTDLLMTMVLVPRKLFLLLMLSWSLAVCKIPDSTCP